MTIMTSNSNIDNNDMEFTLDFDDLDLSFDSEISDDSDSTVSNENTASDEERGKVIMQTMIIKKTVRIIKCQSRQIKVIMCLFPNE